MNDANDPIKEEKQRQKQRKKQIGGKQYVVYLNDKSFLNESNTHYPSNYIKTAKYSMLTFLPLNLFEQFRRIANIYFLMIICIQLIPGVSPFPIGTSIMPLAFILIVGAIKDGIEDYDRHKSDYISNNIPMLRLNSTNGQFEKTVSAQLVPSDIILIKRNQTVPADCIVLGCDKSNGDNSGVCYINTSSMDGENAPKLRRAVQSTANISECTDLIKLKGKIKCPPNTKSLHGFTGALSINKRTFPIVEEAKEQAQSMKKFKTKYGAISDDECDDYLSAKVEKIQIISNSDPENENENENDQSDEDKICGLSDINFIFRGSKLVNTAYIYALVLFVGKESKLMLNRNEVPFKFSKFEKMLNKMIGSILIFNFLLCIVFGFGANIVIEPYAELRRNDWTYSVFLDICSWLILTSWMIPFSLYVTLELVKVIQAQWMAWDESMTFDAHSDNKQWDNEYGGKVRHAKTKNSNLNEELGHIDYVFTDKTGTLTQNLMELSKCSIGGIKYQNDNADYAKISGDYVGMSTMIQKIIKNYKIIKEEQAKNEQTEEKDEINELNKTQNKNQQKNENDQIENDCHFVLNLLLCSATLPSKIISSKATNANHENVQSFDDLLGAHNNANIGHQQNESLVPSSSNNHEVKHYDTDTTNNSDNNSEHESNENDEDDENEDEEQKNNEKVSKIEFQSPSPDEVAFAEALSSFGFILEERQSDGTILIRLICEDAKEIILKFRVLATLDFNARRKRMSVIVEDEMGKIHLYSKGADSTLFRLCKEETKTLMHETKRHVTSFARDGSRTLVIGWKMLSNEEYDEFDAHYREAEVALNDRQQRIEDSFCLVEHSLNLLGCTAVEDQMQDGVPSAIESIKNANIKVIMLTGDKQETAVSIGRQSQIINANIADSDLMFLHVSNDSHRHSAVSNNEKLTNIHQQNGQIMKEKLKKIEKKLTFFANKLEQQQQNNEKNNNNNNNESNEFFENQCALILNGDALEMCLHPLICSKFVSLFRASSAIICNRCNPSQKAMLVDMAKNKLNGVALAIGDGANDVSMIQASNVGIGIMGKEGTQAALASDFVIHRFRHLVRLLFVHGRFAFLRTSQVSLISLYKNMAFMLTVCLYGFYSLYTAQSCFDPYLMSAFNLFFVALFPLMVGAFEQDISQNAALHHPKSYYYFKVDSFFNFGSFLFWMFTALWQSFVWFFISIAVYFDNMDIWQSSSNYSQNGGLSVWGTQIFTTNVIVICLKMMMETKHWNIFYALSTLIGIAAYFIILSILSNWLVFDPDMFYVMEYTFNSPINWLLFLIQCVLCLGPGILYNLWKRERSASLSMILYEAEKFGYLTQNGKHRPTTDIINDYLQR